MPQLKVVIHLKEKRRVMIPTEKNVYTIIYNSREISLDKSSITDIPSILSPGGAEEFISNLLSCFNINRENNEDSRLKISRYIVKAICEAMSTRLEVFVNIEILKTWVYEREVMDWNSAKWSGIDGDYALRSPIESLQMEAFEGGDLGEACVVCLNDFLKGMAVARLPCSHFFHGRCIVQWLELKNSCPIC
ncbi:uncharacterized protein LOC143890952 [Tasmannia lanceolata]